ncbi:5962_t:CDS:2, partial [Racocetra persica]
MALVGKDAQVEFDNKYGATKTTETKLEFNGTEINFSKNLMDGLIIKNCPKLKKININDNEFLRVDLSELGASNVLEDLFANGNQLTDLNVKNCKEIKKLKLRNNAGLNKAKGLEELENIDEIDLTGNPKFRLIHTNKLNGYVEAKEVIKEMLGLNADDSLPDSVRVASGGKLDPDKLKSEITNKINSQVPQLTTDKENAEKERDAANAKLDAQKDYDTIKTERDQLQQQLEAIKTELGLKNDATQQQIIDKIKELKGRPANTDYDAIKSQRDSLQTQ